MTSEKSEILDKWSKLEDAKLMNELAAEVATFLTTLVRIRNACVGFLWPDCRFCSSL